MWKFSLSRGSLCVAILTISRSLLFVPTPCCWRHCDNVRIFRPRALVWLALRACIYFLTRRLSTEFLIVPKPRNHTRKSNRIFIMGARPQWRRVTPLCPRGSLETPPPLVTALAELVRVENQKKEKTNNTRQLKVIINLPSTNRIHFDLL